MTVFHLARRAMTSFRNHPLSPNEINVVKGILLPAEFALWSRMQNRDQRHSLDVLRRFDSFFIAATRDERAAALLHDVGKCESQLGWVGRIFATIVGPRTDSFRTYLDHEQIGLALISNVSAARTSEVLKGDVVDDCVRALRDADNI
jgi:hypothetical protein